MAWLRHQLNMTFRHRPVGGKRKSIVSGSISVPNINAAVYLLTGTVNCNMVVITKGSNVCAVAINIGKASIPAAANNIIAVGYGGYSPPWVGL